MSAETYELRDVCPYELARPRGGSQLEQVLEQIHDRLKRIEGRMATKDDLSELRERMATNDDLSVLGREICVKFAEVANGFFAIRGKLDL